MVGQDKHAYVSLLSSRGKRGTSKVGNLLWSKYIRLIKHFVTKISDCSSSRFNSGMKSQSS